MGTGPQDVGAEVRLVELTEYDEPRLQALIESDPGYAERITGLPPGSSDALSLLISRPPDLGHQDKLVRGIVSSGPAGEELVGVVDLLRGWPDSRTAHLGLLFVHPERRRRGIGRRALGLVAEQLRADRSVTGFRVALVQVNDVGESNQFWSSCGFLDTGERVPYRYSQVESTAEIHRRPLG